MNTAVTVIVKICISLASVLNGFITFTLRPLWPQRKGPWYQYYSLKNILETRAKSQENIVCWEIFVKLWKSHYTDWAIPACNILRPITFKVIKFRDGHFKRSELTFPGPLFGARGTAVCRRTIKSIQLGMCGILDPFCTIAWCVMHVSNLPLNFRLFVWWTLKPYYLRKIQHRESLLVRNPSPSSYFYGRLFFLGKMFL